MHVENNSNSGIQKNTTKLSDQLIWILTVFLFVCFLIFDSYTWGKYAFLLASALIYLISILADGGKLSLKFGIYQIYFLCFILYTALTALWAMNVSHVLTRARTLLRILVCASCLYLHYIKKEDIFPVLTAIKWAGIIVSIYTLFYYGVENVLQATVSSSLRLDNDYTNVNTIGMACALSCVIQIFEWIFFHKVRLLEVAFLLPIVVVIAATQSRKAIVYVIAGVLLLIFLKNIGSKDFLKALFKIFVGIVFAVIVIAVLLQLEMFSGVKERLSGFINSLLGSGEVDNSIAVRDEMVSLGFSVWKQHPLLGIGMDNTYIIAEKYLGRETYLHNNYVEILCGGGLVGFCLYYVMYVYLFVNFMKYRKVNKPLFSICMTWLLLTLIMDWGRVSYYSKTNSFYLMFMFVAVECLKKKHREMKNEAVEVFESRRQVSYGSKVSV